MSGSINYNGVDYQDDGDYIKSILKSLSDDFEEVYCAEAEMVDPETILLEQVPNMGIF
jgi:hypothetical protein